MIDIREYYLNNSLKLRRDLFVPKRYLVAYILKHRSEKVSSIFQQLTKIFNSNQQYRKGYDDFIDETFVLDDKKRIIDLKTDKYKNVFLFNDCPWENSEKNGAELISNLVHNAYDSRDVERLRYAKYADINNVIVKRVALIDCGIDKDTFDFVIGRSILENPLLKGKDFSSTFFWLLTFDDLMDCLIDNVKPENRNKCIKTIRNLSLFSFDPRFEIESLEDIRLLGINTLFYHCGLNIDTLFYVLNYYSESVDDVIPTMFKNYLKSETKMNIEVIRRRNYETLQSIGESHRLTRERIRQYESNIIDNFNRFYLSHFASKDENLIFVFPQLSRVFHLPSVKDALGDDYDSFRGLIKSIKFAGDAKYVKELDSVVESDRVLNRFEVTTNELFGLYFKKVDFEEKVNSCLDILVDYGFNKEIIKHYINEEYRDKGSVFVKKGFRLSKCYQVDYVLENYFDDGFHFSDFNQINELNKYGCEEFGENIFGDDEINEYGHHRIQEIVTRTNAKLVDRGTYVHVTKAPSLTVELVESIRKYLIDKNRPLAYSNLLETFKAELAELKITNRYSLQGALSEYIGVFFKAKRDYITPIEISGTLRENMVSWIKNNKTLFTYEDFIDEFKGAALSVFVGTLYEAKGTAYYWQQGYVNVKYLPITDNDKQKLRQFVEFLIKQYHNEYCSADEIYELVNIQMNELLIKCGMRYSYDLFSVIQVLFEDDFKFSRPLIGSKNAVFENKYQILDSYLSSKDSINLIKLRKYLDNKVGDLNRNYYAIEDIIKDKWNEFVAVDSNTIVRKETFPITTKELTRLDVIVEMLLEEKPKLSVNEDIVQKHIFKEIAGIQTNKYIIYGVLNTFFHDKYSLPNESKSYRNGLFFIELKKKDCGDY